MIKTTITISRQIGAGGSYIGQIVAKRLGSKYIDREVLSLAAQEFGCDEETVAARAERPDQPGGPAKRIAPCAIVEHRDAAHVG